MTRRSTLTVSAIATVAAVLVAAIVFFVLRSDKGPEKPAQREAGNGKGRGEGEGPKQEPHRAPIARPFARDSVWNTPLRPDSPVDPSSAVRVKALAAAIDQQAAGGIYPAAGKGHSTFYQVLENFRGSHSR